jgi:hypothetical protein
MALVDGRAGLTPARGTPMGRGQPCPTIHQAKASSQTITDLLLVGESEGEPGSESHNRFST